MDRATREIAGRWLAAGGPAAVVIEVTDALGSAPRAAGTRMLVSAGASVGTVGGGHLELKAIACAREMLRTGELAPHHAHYPLGPSLGQCCGGAVSLGYRVLDAAELDRWPTTPPLCQLQLYGAGHVGRAVASLLATLDVGVDWIDEREHEFPATTTLGTAWPAHVRRVCVDAVESEVRVAPPGAFYLVMTHDHDLDLRIVEAVLKRADFAYLGLIGSRTKRARFVHRFEARGVDAGTLARLTCPIGIEGIDGKQPEIVALSVVAQLLQRRSEISAPGGAAGR